MKLKYHYLTTVIMIIIAGFLFQSSYKYYRLYTSEKNIKKSTLALSNTQASTTRVEMNLIGRDFGFADSIIYKDYFGNSFLGLNSSDAQYSIYMILSQIGCDLCATELADIINNIKDNILSDVPFRIIVESDSLQYSRRFQKYYQLDIPVYSDYESTISTILNLDSYPIIIIVDENERINYAYHPNPSLQFRNELFEDIIYRILT